MKLYDDVEMEFCELNHMRKDHPLNQESYRREDEAMSYMPLEKLRGADFILTKSFKKTRMAADRILKYLDGNYSVVLESQNIETVIRLVSSGLGISLIPHIYSKIYRTGDDINYYRIEDFYHPIWQWAVIYNESIEKLSRPSRELYNILCEDGCKLPNYVE